MNTPMVHAPAVIAAYGGSAEEMAAGAGVPFSSDVMAGPGAYVECRGRWPCGDSPTLPGGRLLDLKTSAVGMLEIPAEPIGRAPGPL
jgi:hypothetical protein